VLAALSGSLDLLPLPMLYLHTSPMQGFGTCSDSPSAITNVVSVVIFLTNES